MRVNSERGYTLIEMLIVIALLALVAAIASPTLSDGGDATLDRAAREVARALRFARAEAVRTGEPHGVMGSEVSQSLKVYRLDDSVDPPVVYYDVYDPLSKQLFDIRFGSGQIDATITQIYFKFQGYVFPQQYLGFAAGNGVPKYNPSGTVYLLENGYIRLGLEGGTRTVSVAPMTGRVTIQ